MQALPCPTCGGEPATLRGELIDNPELPAMYFAYCPKCDPYCKHGAQSTCGEGGAIAEWNLLAAQPDG